MKGSGLKNVLNFDGRPCSCGFFGLIVPVWRPGKYGTSGSLQQCVGLAVKQRSFLFRTRRFIPQFVSRFSLFSLKCYQQDGPSLEGISNPFGQVKSCQQQCMVYDSSFKWETQVIRS